MDRILSSLRGALLVATMDNGLVLSHRPKGMYPNRGDTELLPDILVDQSSGLRVGDSVQVKRHLLVPWHPNLTPHDVDGFGIDTNAYRYETKAGWEEKEFILLCFATVLFTAKNRCKVSGRFCILGEVLSDSSSVQLFMDTPDNQPVLHWVGALVPYPTRKIKYPPNVPRTES